MDNWKKLENLGDLRRLVDYLIALCPDMPDCTPIQTENGHYLEMTVQIGYDNKPFIETREY